MIFFKCASLCSFLMKQRDFMSLFPATRSTASEMIPSAVFYFCRASGNFQFREFVGSPVGGGGTCISTCVHTSISAPACFRVCRRESSPLCAANKRGEKPIASRAFTSAPAASNTSTTASLASSHAMCSAVRCDLMVRPSTSALRRRSRDTRSPDAEDEGEEEEGGGEGGRGEGEFNLND